MRVILSAVAIAATLFAGVFGTVGCGNTTCDEAVTKLADECELGGAVGIPGANGIVECKEEAECNAQCVLSATCEQIVDEDLDNGYTRCLADCASM